MKKITIAAFLILIAALIWGLWNYNLDSEKGFKAELQKLEKANDSLEVALTQDSLFITELQEQEAQLVDDLKHQKAKVVTIVKTIEVEKEKVVKLSDNELVSFYNNRYPTDTATNPLAVAQPVLVLAAKDLVELDGTKQLLVIKDSALALQDSRLTLKDSIIAKHESRAINFRKIITNQDTQIQTWKTQYTKLEFQNTKLKAQNKFTRIAAAVVTGGLVFMMLAK